jgi:hypothetical protein
MHGDSEYAFMAKPEGGRAHPLSGTIIRALSNESLMLAPSSPERVFAVTT